MADSRGVKKNGFNILFDPSGKKSVETNSQDRLILTPEVSLNYYAS